jgi:hypothetical protein
MAVKTWRALVLDNHGDLVEYVVAVSSRPQARQALLRHGVRANVGELTTTDDVAEALADPGRVYQRGVVFRGGSLTACDGGDASRGVGGEDVSGWALALRGPRGRGLTGQAETSGELADMEGVGHRLGDSSEYAEPSSSSSPPRRHRSSRTLLRREEFVEGGDVDEPAGTGSAVAS